ncbi:MAG: hypothetical protein LBB13_00185 [Rickettsiales bacterium]|nr:hypothetical protein [Rickettsiales bacterium]
MEEIVSDKNGGINTEAATIINTDPTKIMDSNPLGQTMAGVLDKEHDSVSDHIVNATIAKFANNNAQIASSFDPNSTLSKPIDKSSGGSFDKIGIKKGGHSM